MASGMLSSTMRWFYLPVSLHPAFRISITLPASLSSIVIGVPSFIPDSLLSPCCTGNVCSPSGVMSVIAFSHPHGHLIADLGLGQRIRLDAHMPPGRSDRGET